MQAEAHYLFKQCKEAYETLSDTNLKAAYDSRLLQKQVCAYSSKLCYTIGCLSVHDAKAGMAFCS